MAYKLWKVPPRKIKQGMSWGGLGRGSGFKNSQEMLPWEGDIWADTENDLFFSHGTVNLQNTFSSGLASG